MENENYEIIVENLSKIYGNKKKNEAEIVALKDSNGNPIGVANSDYSMWCKQIQKILLQKEMVFRLQQEFDAEIPRCIKE